MQNNNNAAHEVLVVIMRHKLLLLLATILLVALASCSATGHTAEEGAAADDGHIVQSLFRFPASKLGPEFERLLQLWYDEWLYTTTNETDANIITPDPSGRQHALLSVSTPAVTLFRRQCYGEVKSSQLTNLYRNFEQRRKEIEFQHMKDPMEEMKMLHTMTKRFFPAFVPPEDGTSSDSTIATAHMHRKKSSSTVDTIHANTKLPLDYDSPSRLAFQTKKLSDDDDDDENNNDTPIQQWSWRIAGQFSNRGMPNFMQWRVKFYSLMRNEFQNELSKSTPGFKFAFGRPSGMYWYPPGAVREWHSNYLDLGEVTKSQHQLMTGNEHIYASQVWRMYFIRTVRDEKFDGLLRHLGVVTSNDAEDRSAMHIIPGDDEGITLDVLKKAGARPLTAEEKKRRLNDVFAEEYTNPTINSTLASGEDVPKSSEGDMSLDRNSVWRLPDKNGYVTFFRLPKLLHCIISEEVHRYSLGFAFSDEEVQAMLRYAGIEFDVTGNTTAQSPEKDEL